MFKKNLGGGMVLPFLPVDLATGQQKIKKTAIKILQKNVKK
jgi:hypothetical protein